MSIFFQRIYLGCLAQASYLIGSGGEAAIVDPRRDIDDYVELAARQGLRIGSVFLTHAHADFVAGHSELAARGARIHTGRRAECGFERVPLRDGDKVEVGRAVLQVLETPGHTPDSICLLLTDRDAPDQPPKLLSGDTLFLGDVGRPDLAGGVGFDPAAMAAMLYESLRTKIAKLPGAAEVFPGHGAGSACGRNISDAPSSTLEQQRLANPALQPMSQEAFVRELTAGLCPPPPYFARAAELNRRGPRLLAELPAPADLGLDAVAAHRDAGAQVVDTRSADAFGAAHVPGSINIGLSGSFESWCGALLDFDRPVVLVCAEAAQVGEARLRLARVAIEAVAGAALGTRAAFARFAPAASLPQIRVADLRDRLRQGWQVVDVRGPAEYAAGHVPGAVTAPLAELPRGGTALAELAPGRPTAIVCGSGYRSSAAAHWLRRSGFEQLHNVTGGTNAWRDAGFDVER